MRALLILITLADLGLAALLIAVSGFILQGVNNTGPMMPEAIFYVLLILLCFVAPTIAWMKRDGIAPVIVVGIAAAPLGFAVLALFTGPA